MNVTKGDTSELKQAIAFYGPVSILINTQPKSFKFYGSGIYYDPECSKYTNNTREKNSSILRAVPRSSVTPVQITHLDFECKLHILILDHDWWRQGKLL